MAAVAELKAAFACAVEKLQKAQLKWITQTTSDNTDEEQSIAESSDGEPEDVDEYTENKSSADVVSADEAGKVQECGSEEEEPELRPVWYIPNIFKLRPILGVSGYGGANRVSAGPSAYRQEQSSAGSSFCGNLEADDPQRNTTTLKPLKVDGGQYSPYFNMYYGSDGLVYGYATKFALVEGSTEKSTESIGLIATEPARPGFEGKAELVAEKPVSAALLARQVDEVANEVKRVSLESEYEVEEAEEVEEYYEFAHDEEEEQEPIEAAIEAAAVKTYSAETEGEVEYYETDEGVVASQYDEIPEYDEYAEEVYEYGAENETDQVQEDGTAAYAADYDESGYKDEEQNQHEQYQDKRYGTERDQVYQTTGAYEALPNAQDQGTGYAYYKTDHEKHVPVTNYASYPTDYFHGAYANPSVYSSVYDPANGYY